MAGQKKPCLLSHTPSSSSSSSSYSSLYLNPLTNLSPTSTPNKENVAPPVAEPNGYSSLKKKKDHPLQGQATHGGSSACAKPLKPSSLQLCIRLNEPDSAIGLQQPTASSGAWDFSDSEAAPASSWSTLPNRLSP